MSRPGSFLHKRDLVLILALLLIAAAGYGYNRWRAAAVPPVLAQVTVDGQLAQTLDLSVNTTVTITGAGGGTNVLEIKDGEIWCSEASCPDKLCVKQGRKHLSTDTIVCLPNKMVVTITGDTDNYK